MKKSIYIAGPMSGIPQFNFPAFYRAQKRLEIVGWHVWNPARKDAEEELDPVALVDGDALKAVKAGFDFRSAFLWDLEKVIRSNGIYMLQGWEASPGATAEHRVACTMKKHYPDYEIIYEH